jgi:hypothetical protein
MGKPGSGSSARLCESPRHPGWRPRVPGARPQGPFSPGYYVAVLRRFDLPCAVAPTARRPPGIPEEVGSTPATSLPIALIASNAECAPRCGAGRRGRPPHLLLYVAADGRRDSARPLPLAPERRVAAITHSERCCGIPARRARTSVSRYRRWPPSVRIDVSFPAFAHLVTVFGSTRNIVATSAGVSSGSASGVRADMLTASPPGPVLRSLLLLTVRGS